MSVDRFAFNHKYDIRKLRIIYDFSHVADQEINSFIINLIFLELTDIQDTNVIEPFATIKSAKDEKLFCSNHTSGMSLSSGRCFFKF